MITKSSLQIKICNILENDSNNTISSEGETNIIQCCIKDNGNPCFYTETSASEIRLISCSTDHIESSGSGTFQSNDQTKAFIVALTFYETGECQNLFVQFSNPTKCRTVQPNNIFIHKMILNCLFIVLLKKS